jgi:hypothetical protein
MGQQQLLLLVLAAIIVGAGVLLGVTMFQDNAAQANMDIVTQDCFTFAAKAQAWYRRPAAMGGGGQDYANFSWGDINLSPDGGPFVNDNGSYAITAAAGSTCTIVGTGKASQDGDATPLSVTVTITGNNVNLVQTK